MFYNFSNHIICMGDFNINVNASDTPGFNSISLFMSLLSLNQVINLPTRVTNTSSSLIDLIIISNDFPVNSSGVYDMSHASDHSLVYAILDIVKPRTTARFVLRRNLRDMPLDAFNSAAAKIDWSPIYETGSIDDKVNLFYSCILTLFDHIAPIERVRITRPPAPWLTVNLRKLMRMCNQASLKFRKTANLCIGRRYKQLRNLCTATIRSEKRALFNHLSSSSKSSKQFWNLISRAAYYRPRRNPNPLLSFPDPESINNISSILFRLQISRLK